MIHTKTYITHILRNLVLWLHRVLQPHLHLLSSGVHQLSDEVYSCRFPTHVNLFGTQSYINAHDSKGKILITSALDEINIQIVWQVWVRYKPSRARVHAQPREGSLIIWISSITATSSTDTLMRFLNNVSIWLQSETIKIFFCICCFFFMWL